ncbi:tRNA lysidine(34) synthetase TilS [Helicobacter sp. MIT 05-5293]|uniref:tRNA lysidine(34) synthetase TilS n=1 Tax=Helicobacter sp. MIT 05-5293 TaxID=1548149 RepID=UPI00068B3F20|nr:tRNA lysidine(34) synthetase TilS [Helicobacter sp. MIT 05-5293]TLD80861.1 tRNA lysidine(34) synthetase TilS [Helicobacter sp. MIT 05-5293]
MSIYDKLSADTHRLKTSQNLLGFSGGVDSVGLFFILQHLNIPFDIAIINYHTREQSLQEVAYAKQLSTTYHKKCFVKDAPLGFTSNFESQARQIRYAFFDEIIVNHQYTHLILAHQLNDHFEWILMQFAKGAGLGNLVGFDTQRKTPQGDYKIIRPLAMIPKNDIYQYCFDNALTFFEDESNQDMRFKRNFFRKNFSDPFIQAFPNGVAKSLLYLQEDKNILLNLIKPKYLELSWKDLNKSNQKYRIFSINKKHLEKKAYLVLLHVDKIAKELGCVLSQSQRQEIIRTHFSCEIQHRLIITHNTHCIFITHKINEDVICADMGKKVMLLPMNKSFKQKCGNLKIPPKLRKPLWLIFCASNMLDSHCDNAKDYYFKTKINIFFKQFGNFFTP